MQTWQDKGGELFVIGKSVWTPALIKCLEDIRNNDCIFYYLGWIQTYVVLLVKFIELGYDWLPYPWYCPYLALSDYLEDHVNFFTWNWSKTRRNVERNVFLCRKNSISFKKSWTFWPIIIPVEILFMGTNTCTSLKVSA